MIAPITSHAPAATDAAGNPGTCSFSITVRDSLPPEITCPADSLVEATHPSGALVSYPPPTATDAVTSAPTVTVSHPSGSTFPLGTTRVTATARDGAGNSATCAFTETAELHNASIFLRRFPARIVQVFHIQRPSLFQAQLLQIG